MSGAIDIPVVSKFDPSGIRMAQSALGGFSKAVMGLGGIIAGAFAVRAIANFASETIRMGEEVLASNKVLRQVADTTGNFGYEVDSVTKKLIKFADAQELRIGVDAEVVKQVQAQLLSFKKVGTAANITNGIFERTTRAAFDMATVLKTDASSSAIQLAKALEEPIKGITALRRGGTVFTEQQREQIKTLVESNRLLDAQRLILTEVESQYGGAAEAGALWSDRFRLAVEQIKENIGIAPIPSFETFVNWFITNVVPSVSTFFEQDFPRLIESTKTFLGELSPIFGAVGDGLREAFNISEEKSLIEGLVESISKLGQDEEFLGFLKESVQGFAEMLPDLMELVPLMLELAQAVVPQLVSVLPSLITILDVLLDIFVPIVKTVTDLIFWWTSLDDLLPSWAKGLEIVFDPLRVLSESFTAIADGIKEAYDWFLKFIGLESKGGVKYNPLPKGGAGRAQGGRVTGGSPYIVGEVGPELFVPGRGGMIIPNDRLGAGGGANVTINVNAGMGVDGARLGEQIITAIRRYERTSGPVFVRA